MSNIQKSAPTNDFLTVKTSRASNKYTKLTLSNNLTANENLFHPLSTAHDHSDEHMDSTAFLDSGTSRHYFKVNAPLQNVTSVNDGVSVTLLNGESISSTHCGYVPITGISKKARQAKVLPGLTMSSLVSLNQLCDDGCVVTFDDKKATVAKNNKTLFQAFAIKSMICMKLT